MDHLGEGDKKILADIEEHGFHILHVMEDDEGPGFSYTVGLYQTFGHPEIIMIGMRDEITQVILDNFAYDIRNGVQFEHGKFYPEILDDFECLLLQIDQENYKEYLGYAIWYYKSSDFPALQCIYPTTSGAFPWEDAWPEEYKSRQPVLGNLTGTEADEEE